MITRKDILAHLERQVRIGFTVGIDSYSPMRSAFVQEMSSTNAYEMFADLGVVPWPVQNAGRLGAGGEDERTGAEITGGIHAGQQPEVGGVPERAIMIYPVDWEVVISVTHNAINDDATGDLDAKGRAAAFNFQRHQDWLAFAALDGGDGSTYGTCYDALNLFSNSHVDPGASYTTVQDNLNGTTLSLDNFKTIRIAATKFLDNTGHPMGLNHNLLIVPPDLEWEAAQISQNREGYDTANRELNPYAGSVTHIVAPGGWMDTTAWVLIDGGRPEKPIIFIVRQAPTLAVVDDELAADGGVRHFIWKARYNVGYGDWRLAIMGNS